MKKMTSEEKDVPITFLLLFIIECYSLFGKETSKNSNWFFKGLVWVYIK